MRESFLPIKLQSKNWLISECVNNRFPPHNLSHLVREEARVLIVLMEKSEVRFYGKEEKEIHREWDENFFF
jgi:hypothetical protein